MENKRIDKINYYLNIAEAVSQRGTCLKRNYGAVIVTNDEIVSTGYTGSPRGRENCCDKGFCLRKKLNIPRGTRYELCCSVHAEMNAIISASRKEMMHGTLFLCGKEMNDSNDYVSNPDSCSMCKRNIINAGIDLVYIRLDENNYKKIDVQKDWILNNSEEMEMKY